MKSITPEQEEQIMKQATRSVANIAKLYNVPLVVESFRMALVDAYIAGSQDTISFIQNKKAEVINPDDIPF